jgi:hypothetical protein
MVDASPGEQYLASIYWVFQTLTTVGYGDIPAITTSERLISCFIMVLGKLLDPF